jgi:hypothetical protein
MIKRFDFERKKGDFEASNLLGMDMHNVQYFCPWPQDSPILKTSTQRNLLPSPPSRILPHRHPSIHDSNHPSPDLFCSPRHAHFCWGILASNSSSIPFHICPRLSPSLIPNQLPYSDRHCPDDPARPLHLLTFPQVRDSPGLFCACWAPRTSLVL